MQGKDTLPERLRSKINECPGGCWEWTGRRDRLGYGRVGWEGRNALAHRVIFTLLAEPIPATATLDHLCRNRRCVNPAHLEPVTLRENILRGDGVGVRNAAKTHCKNGHEFTPENTYFKQGKRACRECGRLANRRYRARKAGA